MLWTDLFALIYCVSVRPSSEPLQDQSDSPPSLLLLCHLLTPSRSPTATPLADRLIPTGTTSLLPSPSFALPCPQELLNRLPLPPMRLEIALLCCPFAPTPPQVTEDADLLLISHPGAGSFSLRQEGLLGLKHVRFQSEDKFGTTEEKQRTSGET